MKYFYKLIPIGVIGAGFALATTTFADTGTPAPKSAATHSAASTSGHRARDGATLYQTDCARCHTERYPTERTSAQWKTILLHMRTRAQIPGEDARAILKYLQDSK